MSVIPKLATSLGHKDELPNQELAEQIAAKGNTAAVKELIEHLKDKDKGIQSDCIKTLYEIGFRNPRLIAPYIDDFLRLLTEKNNRLQWGGMHALDALAGEVPDEIYQQLPQITAGAEKGSVITRDHYVAILIKLVTVPKYADDIFPLINEVIQSSPTNQLPMYAENAYSHIPTQHQHTFRQTLKSRLPDIEKESKRKRVEKVIRKLGS